MFEQTVETSATPHITITECMGDLVVRGAEEQRVTLRLRGGADDATLEQEGETFTLVARAACFLTCPAGTTLTVRTVRGDLKVKGVQGPVAVGAVYGNATLDATGPAALEQVFGNLSAREMVGSLEVQTARGNVWTRGVERLLSLGQVTGNLRAAGLKGGLEAEQVDGNIRLGPPFPPGATYRLNADGNLRVRLPIDASLRLVLRAAGRVRSRVPDLTLEEKNGETQGILGAGEASLEAQVGGNVTLRPLGPEEQVAGGLEAYSTADLEELGAVVEMHIAEAMTELETRLEESLSRVDREVLPRRVERAVEQARRAAEREAEQARLRAERAERRWRRVSGRRPRLGQELVTDEERLQVLRLVEEGKITPEQAADLLAALEGR
ncbi:MAG: hypothetical protein ISS49_00160 [Anaerolineae bacterium]|nr:hypothetical protein [Anaerolineae bacterium]